MTRRTAPFFLHLGAGIDIDAEIFGGLVGILGGFHRAERSFDFHVIAVLVT